MSVTLTRNQLTTESKTLLRKTVRGLRESLIAELKDSAEQRYLLSMPIAKAADRLDAATLERRRRLEAALDQAAAEEGGGREARARAFDAAAKEAGATLLNRLVLIRHLEALGLSKPAVLTGGWMSKGYREFQQVAATLCEDDTQGMAPLLNLLFAELAVALPGLFGDVGLTSLLDVPAATLRGVIEALDAVPAEAWHDDLTLGWVYQYWNDPDREALDAKIAASGKIEPHEIASKTQMFTERYMVEWLLQNSLGPTWLAMCKKHGWTAEAESSGVLAQLDKRRADWRKKREAGEVAPDALMPVDGPLEQAWKYYVPQPLPDEVVKNAPESIRELKLLDPACGSGHFLVVAFDLLVELYREEARHKGESWTDKQIAEWILENNLHGIDIDPRAVQIAAAAVYLKARALAKDVDPQQVNLVAPMLKLSALAKDDPGLVQLAADLQSETGIPPELTRRLIDELEGVDHLGSLLKVGDAIDRVVAAHEGIFAATARQTELFGGAVPTMPLDRAVARRRIETLLSSFLASHAGSEDLGLRLRGQQLSAGLRFASMAKEGTYHLVVGNPPYQGTSKMKSAGYVAKNYPMGKSDLYAAFLERGLQLCRPGGASAMVTMRSWMFLSGFTALREHLLKTFDLRILGDVDRGAFEEVPDEVVATAMSVFRRTTPATEPSIAMQPTPLSDKSRDSGRTARKRAAVLAQVGRYAFRLDDLKAVALTPIIYWWTSEFRRTYAARPKLAELAPAKKGMTTSDNVRFIRRPWEVAISGLPLARAATWQPYVLGAKGRAWFEPLSHVIRWADHGLEVKAYNQHLYGSYSRSIQNEQCYFSRGVAFSTTGADFRARVHLVPSIIDSKGSSVYPPDPAYLVCLLNSRFVREVLQSLNPTIDFKNVDVDRVPLLDVPRAAEVFAVLEDAFSVAEERREQSVSFKMPGGSTWSSAEAWAEAVLGGDAQVGGFVPREDACPPDKYLSYQFGVAIGRFRTAGGDAQQMGGNTRSRAGIVFLAPAGRGELGDGVGLGLTDVWEKQKPAGATDLGTWLRNDFWKQHREDYENRPIYFPLTSSKRSFVAYVSIHRWSASTLTTLLTEYLIPERKALEGSLADLRTARATADKKSRSDNDRLFAQQSKWLEELEDFIAKVTQCTDKGPPSEPGTPPREVDAPYVMDLDDGVMVNAASLWPLLEPMWKDPKKWWKELATAKGRKDYDWSHLAARYFPSRVDEKCKKDPSLAVAHGCFWKYHPEKAYQWELRLQDEIGPDFLINEKDSDARRKAFLEKEPNRAAELEAAEQARRQRKAAKEEQQDLELESDGTPDDEEAA